MKAFKEGLRKALYVPPTYAGRPSDAALVEGWKIAYEQEKERRETAEKRLEMVEELAEGYRNSGQRQVGLDFMTILTMSKEELYEDYGD
jgi:hypothetical protein